MQSILIPIFSLVLAIIMVQPVFADQEKIRLEIKEDTYTESIFFDETHGSLSQLLLGYGNSPREGITRLFIKYNPKEAENIYLEDIEKVTLNLYQTRVNNPYNYDINIGTPVEEWREVDLIFMPVNPFSWQNESVASLPAQTGWVSIDITDIFTKQFLDPATNRGIAITMVDEMQMGGVFWSKDCINPPAICNSQNIPYVEVTVMKEDQFKPDIKIIYTSVNQEGQFNMKWESNLKDDEKYKIVIEKDGSIYKTFDNLSLKEFNHQFAESGIYNIKVVIKKYSYESAKTTIEIKLPLIQDPVEIEPDLSLVKEINNAFKESVTEIINQLPEPKVDVIKEVSDPDIEKSSSKQVLGVNTAKEVTNKCTYIWNSTTGKVRRKGCSILPPKVLKADTIGSNSSYTVINTLIEVPHKLLLTIERRECLGAGTKSNKPLICLEIIREKKQRTVDIEYLDILIEIDGRLISARKSDQGSSYSATVLLSNKPITYKLRSAYRISFSQKIDSRTWLDIFEQSPLSVAASFSINKALSLYTFPLDKIFNVTQWHGDTEYQTPHTGIDFEATKQNVKALAKGTIEFIGWDKGPNRCLSGGNYIKLKHSDGKYSTYLHLEKFAKGLKKGSIIEKGQILAISGNSGLFNCEHLSSHLHVELRKGSLQKTHIDPVPYINIDWTKVKTARASLYPGRLSGDNPHPTY
ncbi:MAG: Membrane protein metalloendopeptidase [candidate division WS6 bacterium GW2011_GWF2_39_15]|uniref:Membrane protein metalloendopeptidase n=1 Tax=candidate division WS6 bacterium GW2011_GWF2_39_15 TaxID=1619100 RepID=A0A0G0QVW8_9BACT|nr:MAG: Membrane protein metalloendopeptidase [candidate division WS6 bacterium GW2011_GWF2_39_15]